MLHLLILNELDYHVSITEGLTVFNILQEQEMKS